MMKVRLLAATQLYDDLSELEPIWNIKDADTLAEFAGRACYQSWSKPNPATASNDKYLASIIAKQHYSVLEHASATVYICGVSRSLTHELVRHRHMSFSQVSQRFVDSSSNGLVMPPAIAQAESSAYLSNIVDGLHLAVIRAYNEILHVLKREGKSHKEATEAARAVLPNATDTRIVVTGNHRAWRELIEKRNSPGADAEMQELAIKVLELLRPLAPNTYQDL